MSSLPPALDFPAAEEEICQRWKDEQTFRTQDKLSLERGDEKFTFYDGPPFATGLPHYGHILAGTIKDTVTRYACMSGRYVERRAGWDCFPEDDARVLTANGFMFLYELEVMLASGRPFPLFAAYDVASSRLVYRPGKLVIKDAEPRELVNITEPAEQLRWSPDADEYGSTKSNERNKMCGHVSVRVTSTHKMYVQFGSMHAHGRMIEWQNKNGAVAPYSVVPASMLLQPTSSAQETTHHRHLAVAANGVSGNAKHVCNILANELSLCSIKQVNAFLELYGYWLGNGRLAFKDDVDGHGIDAVEFTQCKKNEVEWLRTVIPRVGLTLGKDVMEYNKSSNKMVTFLITEPHFVNYFHKEYACKKDDFDKSPESADIKVSNRECVKWFWNWVLKYSTAEQLRLIIKGLQRANCDFVKDQSVIYTSSIEFRDELVVVLMHAGFATHFQLGYKRGAVRGYTGTGRKVISLHVYEQLSERDRGRLKPILAQHDIWTVHYTNTGFGAKPVLDSSNGVSTEDYSGRVWCVAVDHPDHLIVTQRAFQSDGVVTKVSRPIIVSNCHGLPVEYEIDQKLNITHRNQVLEMGIDKYNATCRSIVTRYTQEWEATINRLGRWIDFENDYKTMDPSFMESVWWVFAQLFDKKLVYQGYKVMPYSTACTTPLSNFEAGLNYKDVKDPAIVVRFPIIDAEDKASFVAWTTTPWTLPSNLALCVNPELEYVKILDKASNNLYVLGKTRLCQLYPIMNNKKKWKPEKAAELYEILATYKGSDLVGWKYEPLFDFFANTPQSSNYFQVLSDSYVTDDAGTGVVHQAPAFGEDDYRVCLAHNIISKGGDLPCPVDVDGNFSEPVTPVLGKHVKDADEILIQLIKDQGKLVQKDVLLHSYPFCWRSDTPLIYKAVPSWFVKVEDIKDQVVACNQQTYWVPNEVKEGRFHNWLSDARDWAVSRNRFWGTPIPIWANEDLSEMVCVSSIAQLEELSGVKVDDLHRETVDKVTIPSKNIPGTVLSRVEEVFDCWFESGSMPYAQSHYPFENKDDWEKGFPADFIAEGLDQTRGWFYTLMVLSTALFGKPAFKNNIVNGMVLAADGQKMSKRKKNYPDPSIVISKYGADALRMYLMNSPVVRAEPLKFQEAGVLGVVKEVFLPLYNAFRFFFQNMERWEHSGKKFVPSVDKVRRTKNPTDIWIQAGAQNLIKFVHDEMKAYRLYTVMPALVAFSTQLTNWYVRLNRDRLKGLEGEGTDSELEAETGLQVLYDVLLDVTILMAPFTPFITEFFYQHLRKVQESYKEAENGGGVVNPVKPGKSDSVHFLRLPMYDESRMNQKAVESMTALQAIVEHGRTAREKRNISLRTPVKNVVVVLRNPPPYVVESLTDSLKKYILSELNTFEFQVIGKEEEQEWVSLSLTLNFSVLGKKLGKKMKAVQTAVQSLSHTDAVKCLEEGRLEVEGETLDTETELQSKLQFAKDGSQWEASVKVDGSLVVAVDCTQDDEILSAGMSRELINGIQQLRKSAGLDLKDIVEAFFEEELGISVVENAVSSNVALFKAKFKGLVPLPERFAPTWSVFLKSSYVEIGGAKVKVSICRPTITMKDQANESAKKVLSTLEPNIFSQGQSFSFSVDGNKYTLKEGEDFWLNTASKLQATNAVDWL